MFAAVGNHVLSLERVSIGGLEVGDLASGQWRVLGSADRHSLFEGG